MGDTPLEELRRESADWHHCWDGDDSAPVDEGFAIDAALIAALGDEIAELTGQNIDLEVWRASAVKRAEQAEAERERLQCCGNCDNWSYAHRHAGEYMLCSYDAEDRSREPSEPCGFAPSRWTEREA